MGFLITRRSSSVLCLRSTTTLHYRPLVEADCGAVACQALHGKIGLERNRIVWPKHGASCVGTQ